MGKAEKFTDVCGSEVKEDILNLKWFMVNFKGDIDNGTAYYFGKDELDVVRRNNFTVNNLEDINYTLIEVNDIPIISKMIYFIDKNNRRYVVLYTGSGSFFRFLEKIFREGKPHPSAFDYEFEDGRRYFKVVITNYTVDLYEL